jgi:hypothetical protein
MLVDKSRGYYIPAQPHNRCNKDRACVREKALAHSDFKRPRKKSKMAKIVGEQNIIGIINVDRIGAHILVEQYFVAKRELVEKHKA